MRWRSEAKGDRKERDSLEERECRVLALAVCPIGNKRMGSCLVPTTHTPHPVTQAKAWALGSAAAATVLTVHGVLSCAAGLRVWLIGA